MIASVHSAGHMLLTCHCHMFILGVCQNKIQMYAVVTFLFLKRVHSYREGSDIFSTFLFQSEMIDFSFYLTCTM